MNSKVEKLHYASSVMEYESHGGSEHSLDMKVSKVIVKREAILMKLHQVHTMNSDTVAYDMLNLLSKLRESSLSVVDAIQEWRKSIVDQKNTNTSSSQSPATSPKLLSSPPFIWKGVNYLLKLISDSNFIINCEPFTKSLGMQVTMITDNPLMLPNSLRSKPSSKDPYTLAFIDSDGQKNSSLYQERLRLRLAEVILSNELQLYGNNNSTSSVHDILPKSLTPRNVNKTIEQNEFHTVADSKIIKNQSAEFQFLPVVVHSVHSKSTKDAYRSNTPDITTTTTTTTTKMGTQRPASAPGFKQAPSRHSQGGGKKIYTEINADELRSLLDINNPSHRIKLTAACCIILLSPGLDVPKDASFRAFQSLIRRDANKLVYDLSQLSYQQLSKVKVNAMKPFLLLLNEADTTERKTMATDDEHTDQDLVPVSVEQTQVIDKLYTWILKVSHLFYLIKYLLNNYM